VRRLLFCLEELERHLREHRGVVALAVSTMAVAFFLLGLFLLVWVNIRDMVRVASDEAHVQVFLKDGIDRSRRDAIRTQLEQESAVESVTYVSEDDALVRFKARLKLAKLPRNSSPTRLKNRCQVTGRPRAYYRKLKMSRIALRDLASHGEIPGMVKSSW